MGWISNVCYFTKWTRAADLARGTRPKSRKVKKAYLAANTTTAQHRIESRLRIIAAADGWQVLTAMGTARTQTTPRRRGKNQE